MQKFVKFHIFTVIFLLFLCLSGLSVSANEYQDTLRVGIYYGSGTVQTMNFQSKTGFSFGCTEDRNFLSFGETVSTSVTVVPVSSETHHVLYSTHNNVKEMKEHLYDLSEQGLDVFPAFHSSSYCIFSGSFSNSTDALTSAQNLGKSGSVVSVPSGAICLKDDQTQKTLFLTNSSERILSVFSNDTENSDSFLTISGTAKGTYRGGFECKYSGSGFTVVNIVPVESYLYSVVCREMSSSWHTEALKAQAVCARNFALGRIGYHKNLGFDVCRTVCCQAYSTEADTTENVHTAVNETRGELLFYEDELVQAVYSSSMGSSTESVENVWGTPFPYLVSVENPYEDTENIYNGKWTKKLTKARATEIMNNRGYNIGTVTDIRILEYTPAGRVLKLSVIGTNGQKTFERESCRTIFSEATYSQKYSVSAGGLTTYPTVQIYNGTNTVSKSASDVTVLTGKNKTEAVNENPVVLGNSGKKTFNSETTPGEPDTFVFSGEGWGHGVGMSQYGAKGMAEAGFDYEEILTHYYTGTHLEQAY